MPLPDWGILLPLLAALAAVQLLCWLLARGLRLRLGWRVAACGIALPLAFLWPWLDGERLLVPCDVLMKPVHGAPWVEDPDPHDLLNDAVYQFLPWELEVRHALAERRLPFWSDLLEGGSSPWANPQAGALSPLQMPARLLPIQHHLLAALALKILVAFEGTWLLARRVGRSRPSSLLAAAGFALSGGVMAWALFPHTAAVAWVPWLTAATVGLFRRPSGRTVAATAVVTALLLLSGHPEVAAIGGLFAALCGIWLRRRLGFPKGLAAAATAALLGFALAAPHLFPFLHLLPRSQRALEMIALEMPASHPRWDAPLSWFLPGHGAFVLAPTNPRVFGIPYEGEFRGPYNWADAGSGYAGLLAWGGAFVALLAGRDRRARPFLAFAVLAPLLAARFLPLAYGIFAVPPLRVPAYPRFLLVGCLAFVVAAAFGVDRLLRRATFRALAALVLAAVLSLAVAPDPWVWKLWGLLLAGAIFARFRPVWGAALLGVALLLDLVPWSRGHLPQGHPGLFYPRTPFVQAIAQEVNSPGGPWRAVGAEYLVYPSLLPVYGIAELRPHNPLAPMDFLRALDAAFGFDPSTVNYFSRFADADHPLLDVLGVRAVVGSPAMPPSRTLERIDGGRFAPFTLFRNPDALPRWFVPAAAEVVGREEVWRWIARLREPGRVALLAEEAVGWRPAGLPGRVLPAAATAAAPGRVALALPPGGAELVATSIPFSEGWRAGAGGERLPTLRIDGALLGVRVPAGTAALELTFLPPGFVAGVAACLLAAAACAVLAWPRGTKRAPALLSRSRGMER